MRTQLMTVSSDFTNQARVMLRNPAEHKKRCPNVVSIQQIQQVVGIVNDAALILTPLACVDRIGKSGYLVVIIDVNSKRVNDAH